MNVEFVPDRESARKRAQTYIHGEIDWINPRYGVTDDLKIHVLPRGYAIQERRYRLATYGGMEGGDYRKPKTFEIPCGEVIAHVIVKDW